MRSSYLEKIAQEWGVPYWDAYALIMYSPQHRDWKKAYRKLKGKFDETDQ